MKKIKRIGLLTAIFCLTMTNIALADEWNWESAIGHHNQSVLLDESITNAEDIVYRNARGDYLAEGSVQIANMQDGRIRVNIMTLAHRNVDKIMHSVYLDVLDTDSNSWKCLNFWEFELTKEETDDGELYMLDTYFYLTGYETNRYYRVRGLHGVEFNDELEACATESDGVLITDGPT